MKKPINLGALVFWWLGALIIVSDIPIMSLLSIGVSQALKEINHAQFTNLNVWATLWMETRFAVLTGLQFIGIGLGIELLDQIRWNALPSERQIPRRTLGEVIRRLRSWPHRS